MTYVDWIIIGVSCAVIITICILIVVFGTRNKKTVLTKQGERLVLDADMQAVSGYLSTKEFTFYKVLASVASDLGLVAFPKVNLCDIVVSRDENVKKNPVFHDDVDFCLFTTSDFKPVCIVDLYNGRIGDQTVFEIDGFASKALKKARIPVCKVETDISYDKEKLKDKVQEAIAVGSRELK